MRGQEMSLHATQRAPSQTGSSQQPIERMSFEPASIEPASIETSQTISRGEFLRMAGLAALGSVYGAGPRRNTREALDRSHAVGDPYRDLHPVIERLQTTTIDYFTHNRRHGLVLDQSPVANWPFSSMAATGFGLSAYVLGVERGKLSRTRAVELIDETLRTIEREPTLRHRGWFTHFVDVSDPERPITVRDSVRSEKPTAEYSSIDTALFFLAALPVGTYFGVERDIQGRIEKLFQEVDFPFMLHTQGSGDPRLFSHGFYLDEEGAERFIPTRWDTCSEGILVSFLSLADAQPSVSPNVWEAWSRDYQQLPLFVRYYPHCFVDLRDCVDRTGLNLWGLAQQEVNHQIRYCQEHGFPDGFFGVTACAFAYKGPSGADQYGYFVPAFRGSEEPRVVGPHAIVACVPFAPRLAYESIRHLAHRGWLESDFGPINSVNLDDGLVHRGVTAIDVGSTLLMLDAGSSRVIHKLSADNPRIQAAMRHCGLARVSRTLPTGVVAGQEP